MKYIFSFLFMAVSAVGISAQQNNYFETVINTCGNFKMPVIVPPSDFDSAFIVKPVAGQNSKIISINPCGETNSELMKSQLTKSTQDNYLKNLFAPKKQ